MTTKSKNDHEYAHLYGDISARAFQLYLKDLDTLRSKYRRCEIDVPYTMIARLPRDKVVNAILAMEFGIEALIEYISESKARDRDKEFCTA